MTEKRNDLPLRPLTAAEQLAFRDRLWGLLARQTALYTMGDSTSVPVETATALLASIHLSLELYLREEGLPPTALLAGDPEELLRAAEGAVRRQVGRARLQYARARRCFFQEESIALADTLGSIGGFFRAYDPKYFAAEVPCDIDYQLCRPVPETPGGMVYLRAYLDGLLTEDAFLRRFDPAALRRLWAAGAPDHRELLVNLYEPAACAALGVTLTEGSLFSLDQTRQGQARLSALLEPLPPSARRVWLVRAGETLARRLDLSPSGRSYLLRTAEDLSPRVDAVLARDGNWQMVFPALSAPIR